MSDPRRQSPLDHRQTLVTSNELVSISERPFFSKHILRIKAEDAAKRKIELPAASKVFQSSKTQILWLGPDEWMFVAPADAQNEIHAELTAALSGLYHQIVDVSDFYTIIRISGDKSAELLMKLSTLDLHPRTLKPGSVLGSVFGKANAWLIKNEDDGQVAFDLIVRWSMADYLWCLLAEAGREFGLPAQVPRGQDKGLRDKNG